MDESIHKAQFSWIRVIVVVFIIILLGFFLLMWSQGNSRETARRRKCLSNLKQIGLALKQYALDNNETFPWGNDIEPYQALGKLHPTYASALEVFRCPSSSDAIWHITNAHMYKNKDNASFIYDACKKSLSYAYSFNKDGNRKGKKGPWTENAPSSLRLAADKYITYDYSSDPNSKTKPSNHPIRRSWFKYKCYRQFVYLDGSAKWEFILTPLDVDSETEYENSGHPESDQTGAKWWSDPPEKQ
jgi:type II secretory pathway pseudopilin PulG